MLPVQTLVPVKGGEPAEALDDPKGENESF